MSDHAERVLSVLLERLQKKSVLNDTALTCALVRPPSAFIKTGLPCFDQACATEMLTAVKALDTYLATDNLHTCINMSLGTHVGPHNGESPLEDYIAKTLTKTTGSGKKRFLVVAAGNEGGTGWSAKCEPTVDDPGFLH